MDVRNPGFVLTEDPPFLGIERSVTGRRWEGLSARQDRLSLQITQQCKLPGVLARTLARRNLKPWEVPSYLDPSPVDEELAISQLDDLDPAAHALTTALLDRQKIAIVADSGVDGCCASVMFRQALSSADHTWPEMVTWRYRSGPVTDIALDALASSHEMVILLDFGTSESALFTLDSRRKFMIVDNDVSDHVLPGVLALLNGNRHDQSGNYSDLCTAGLVFMLLTQVNRLLVDENMPEMDLGSLHELVCLACASERVSLAGNNRSFVSLGLQQARRRQHPGLRALADTIPLKQKLRYHDLGTGFAQRLAYGSVTGTEPLAASLLMTGNAREAESYASVLNDFHNDGIEDLERIIPDAIDMAAGHETEKGLVWAARTDWTTAQLEQIAAALQAHFQWPALALRLEGPIAVGYAVGMPGFDLGVAIANCRAAGIEVTGGGHQMKAAIAMPIATVTEAIGRISRFLHRQVPFHEASRDMRLDGIVTTRSINTGMVTSIDRAGPFGIGSPRPRYALAHQQVIKRRKIGSSHLFVKLRDRSGQHIDGFVWDGYASDLGVFLRKCGPRSIHLAGTLGLPPLGHGNRALFSIEDAGQTGD